MTALFTHDIAKIILVTALVLTVLAFLHVLASIAPSAAYSVASFLIFGLYILSLGYASPVSFVLLLPYIFFRATTLLSGIAIEHGGYMEDIETLGEATGAYTRLAAIYVVFISFAAIVIESLYAHLNPKSECIGNIRKTTQKHLWVPVFFGIFILFSFYMLHVGITHGFPLLTGVDRFVFREETGTKGYLFFMSNRYIAALLFGIIIFLCNGMRQKIALALSLIMFVISVLFGEKFTSLVLMSIYLMTPAYLMSRRLQKNILKHLIPALIAVSMMTLPVVLVVYNWFDTPQKAQERLATRMVGQGELWFVADRDTNYAFKLDKDAITHNIESLYAKDPREMADEPPYLGVQYFMFNYMETQKLRNFISRSSLTLTLGLEPYFLMTFGWVGMYFPLLLCSLFYAAVLSYLAWGIVNARPISIFAASKMLIWIVAGLAQGYLFMIFGYKMAIIIVITIFYELVSKNIFKALPGQKKIS